MLVTHYTLQWEYDYRVGLVLLLQVSCIYIGASYTLHVAMRVWLQGGFGAPVTGELYLYWCWLHITRYNESMITGWVWCSCYRWAVFILVLVTHYTLQWEYDYRVGLVLLLQVSCIYIGASYTLHVTMRVWLQGGFGAPVTGKLYLLVLVTHYTLQWEYDYRVGLVLLLQVRCIYWC